MRAPLSPLDFRSPVAERSSLGIHQASAPHACSRPAAACLIEHARWKGWCLTLDACGHLLLLDGLMERGHCLAPRCGAPGRHACDSQRGCAVMGVGRVVCTSWSIQPDSCTGSRLSHLDHVRSQQPGTARNATERNQSTGGHGGHGGQVRIRTVSKGYVALPTSVYALVPLCGVPCRSRLLAPHMVEVA